VKTAIVDSSDRSSRAQVKRSDNSSSATWLILTRSGRDNASRPQDLRFSGLDGECKPHFRGVLRRLAWDPDRAFSGPPCRLIDEGPSEET
jgi:hypothetical protein